MKFLKLTLAFGFLFGLLGVAASVPGQGRGNGNGNGGGPGEETAQNSLSVPTIFVGSEDPAVFQAEFNLPETVGTLIRPEAAGVPPQTGYPVDDGYYYVQGIHTWQADCKVGDSTVSVDAVWGDNLTSGKLKVGSPIRVEMGLLTTVSIQDAMTGWDVIKLEPLQLDRLAYYGTLANPLDAYRSIPLPYTSVRVYDIDAEWTITNVTDPNSPIEIFSGFASAEVNSTGRIVYGHNLRVTEAGTYQIEFYAPNVTFNGQDANDKTVTIIIEVAPGGGKGGGRPN